MTTTKRCTQCGIEYPFTPEYFHKIRKNLHAKCKSCMNEIARQHYLTNIVRIRKRHREYQAQYRLRKKDTG